MGQEMFGKESLEQRAYQGRGSDLHLILIGLNTASNILGAFLSRDWLNFL